MIISISACTDQRKKSQPQVEKAPISAYRGRTLGLLRRYFRMSLDIGRLPSFLGRELFRASVSSYHVHSFEDVVILVHDVERCLERLDDFSRTLISRVVFQDYTWEETAVMMHCGRRTVARRFPRALDLLSETFLQVGLLSPFPSTSPDAIAPACQEATDGGNRTTCCTARQ